LGPLVGTEWLQARLGERGLRVADVRWYLDPARRGRDAYTAGHIPGAVFVDIDEDLSAPGGARGSPRGRHPWPGPELVARSLGRAGIGRGTRVVAYDDQGGGVAARLWYVLRAYGHDDVAVLDGGIAKWLAEGRPLERGERAAEPAVFFPQGRDGWVVETAELAALVRSLARPLILDARAGERYRGEKEPIDPRAGHVPGAKSAPFSANLQGGVFLPPEALRRLYVEKGALEQAPIVYCGSGVNACHDLLALERAGLRGRLYAGSWSAWSSDPSLPVETGEES